MPTVSVNWIRDRTFIGTDENGHSIVLSGDNPPVGVRPSQMLLVSLAACTAYDVAAIMEKKRQPLSRLEVIVDGRHADTQPAAFQTIHVTYRVAGQDIKEAALARAIQLSEEKYCSVAATIRGVAEITTAYEMIHED